MSENRVLVPFKENGHAHQRCMESALTVAEQTCRARGVRLTNIRRRVLELVWRSHEPVKAYDILACLQDETPAQPHPRSIERSISCRRKGWYIKLNH